MTPNNKQNADRNEDSSRGIVLVTIVDEPTCDLI